MQHENGESIKEHIQYKPELAQVLIWLSANKLLISDENMGTPKVNCVRMSMFVNNVHQPPMMKEIESKCHLKVDSSYPLNWINQSKCIDA